MNIRHTTFSKSVTLALAIAASVGSVIATSVPARADKSDKPIVIVVGPVTKTPADPPKK